jgi:hypothetical protein
MPAEYPTRRNPFADGGQLSDMRREYPVGPMPDMPMSDMQLRMPVEATRGVVPEPNYSGGLGSLFGGMSGSVPYPSSPPPSGIGPLTYSNQQRMPVPQEPYAGMYTGQNPQLLAQMEMAKTAEAQRAAELQRQKQQLLSQPYDPRQLIG